MTNSELKQWREKLGISRELASVALGVSRSTIARYEKDSEIPKYIALACKQILIEEEVNNESSEILCINGFLDFASGFKFTNLQQRALWLIFLDGLSKKQVIKQTGIDPKDLDKVHDQFYREIYPPWHKGARAYFRLKKFPLQPYSVKGGNDEQN